MKRVNINEIYQSFYFAYYKGAVDPIALSDNIELLKEYMEVHRHVLPNKYSIEELKYTIGEIELEYPYSIIEQYEDWYIPRVDIEMINFNKSSLQHLFDDTLNGMKEIMLLTSDIKKIPINDREIIISAMKIISDYRKSKKIWNKIVDNYKLSDLLYLDMDEYLTKRRFYIDMKENRMRWDFMIEMKGGDK